MNNPIPTFNTHHVSKNIVIYILSLYKHHILLSMCILQSRKVTAVPISNKTKGSIFGGVAQIMA